MAGTQATGTGPFEFTDSNGKHVSIPLTAITFDANSKPLINSAWQHVFATQPAAASLLAYAVAEGLIAPAPAPSPFPAMIVKAVDGGLGGNNITVAISNIVPDAGSPPTNDPTRTSFTITVTETDIYNGLTAASIEQTLGSADGTFTSVVKGTSTGLVQVLHGSVEVYGTPHSVSAATFTGPPYRLDVNGSASPPKVFTLIPKKAGSDARFTKITITPNTSSPPQAGPGTFLLQATWTQNATATLETLASVVQSMLGYEISVSPPGSGSYSVPAVAVTSLSGGAPGASASASLFTGI